LCAVGPAFIFQLFAKFMHENLILKYLLLSVSSLLFGLGLSYFAPIMTLRCKIMSFLPGYASDYEDKLE